MATRIRKKERRYYDKVILVERRKGKFLMYGQIILSIGLILCLLWLLK
jgi:hypothetical protein